GRRDVGRRSRRNRGRSRRNRHLRRPALSAFNSCLVLRQLPNASMVGGFRQWLDKGRAVRKGEHGLMIWLPTKGKDDADQPVGLIWGTVLAWNDQHRVRSSTHSLSTASGGVWPGEFPRVGLQGRTFWSRKEGDSPLLIGAL